MQRADLRQYSVGGRNQPYAAQDAERPAGSHAGTVLHGERQHLYIAQALPEAQLDRFLFNTILDYLTADEEMQVVDLTTTTKVAHADTITSAEEIAYAPRNS